MSWQHKWMIIWLCIKLRVTIKKIFLKNAIYSFIFRKKILIINSELKHFSKCLLYTKFIQKKILKSIKKSSPVMLRWFHKIPFYHLNKRILWKLYLLYSDYLISQKYKKCFPGKYAMLLYVAVSIRRISVRFDFQRDNL